METHKSRDANDSLYPVSVPQDQSLAETSKHDEPLAASRAAQVIAVCTSVITLGMVLLGQNFMSSPKAVPAVASENVETKSAPASEQRDIDLAPAGTAVSIPLSHPMVERAPDGEPPPPDIAPPKEAKADRARGPARPAIFDKLALLMPAPAFDSYDAKAAIDGAAGHAAYCLPKGEARRTMRVSVTFSSSGQVKASSVVSGPFASTDRGGCVARAFYSIKVPPFHGDAVTVSRQITLR